jgi:hypothetical protein
MGEGAHWRRGGHIGGGEQAYTETPAAVDVAADPVETRSAPPPPLAPPAGSPGLPQVPPGLQSTG